MGPIESLLPRTTPAGKTHRSGHFTARAAALDHSPTPKCSQPAWARLSFEASPSPNNLSWPCAPTELSHLVAAQARRSIAAAKKQAESCERLGGWGRPHISALIPFWQTGDISVSPFQGIQTVPHASLNSYITAHPPTYTSSESDTSPPSSGARLFGFRVVMGAAHMRLRNGSEPHDRD